jgi:hypothetical protein
MRTEYRATRREAVKAAAREVKHPWNPAVWRQSPLNLSGPVKMRPVRSNYHHTPHQGRRETARRLQQAEGRV